MGTQSIERDFGYSWTAGTPFPVYRVSWVEETGELYALNCSTKTRHTLAHMDRDSLDHLMADWPTDMHKPNSLVTLCQRAGQYVVVAVES